MERTEGQNGSLGHFNMAGDLKRLNPVNLLFPRDASLFYLALYVGIRARGNGDRLSRGYRISVYVEAIYRGYRYIVIVEQRNSGYIYMCI